MSKEFSFNLKEKMANAKKELENTEDTIMEVAPEVEKSTDNKVTKSKAKPTSKTSTPTSESIAKNEKKSIVTEKTGKSVTPIENHDEPRLFVSGRLSRKDQVYIARSLHVSEHLLSDIKKYCKGNEVAIFNYLIHEGLRKVKSSDHMIYADITDLEIAKD